VGFFFWVCFLDFNFQFDQFNAQFYEYFKLKNLAISPQINNKNDMKILLSPSLFFF
jgi:hypothetical protein